MGLLQHWSLNLLTNFEAQMWVLNFMLISNHQVIYLSSLQHKESTTLLSNLTRDHFKSLYNLYYNLTLYKQ